MCYAELVIILFEWKKFIYRNLCCLDSGVLGEQLAKEMECYFAEVAAAEQVSSIADAFNELGREVHSVRRRSKPPMSSSSTHSLFGSIKLIT